MTREIVNRKMNDRLHRLIDSIATTYYEETHLREPQWARSIPVEKIDWYRWLLASPPLAAAVEKTRLLLPELTTPKAELLARQKLAGHLFETVGNQYLTVVIPYPYLPIPAEKLDEFFKLIVRFDYPERNEIAVSPNYYGGYGINGIGLPDGLLFDMKTRRIAAFLESSLIFNTEEKINDTGKKMAYFQHSFPQLFAEPRFLFCFPYEPAKPRFDATVMSGADGRAVLSDRLDKFFFRQNVSDSLVFYLPILRSSIRQICNGVFDSLDMRQPRAPNGF